MKKIRFFLKGASVDENTKGYVESKIRKLGKFFESFHDDAEIRTEVEIELDKKGKFRVEIMLHTPYKSYRGSETSDSIEGSTDLVYEELETQIRRDIEKMITLSRRGGRSVKKKMVIDEKARF